MSEKVLWITGNGWKTDNLSGRVFNSNVYHFDDRENDSRVLVKYNFHMHYYEFEVWEHCRLWGIGIGYSTVLGAYNAGASNYNTLCDARRDRNLIYHPHVIGPVVANRGIIG